MPGSNETNPLAEAFVAAGGDPGGRTTSMLERDLEAVAAEGLEGCPEAALGAEDFVRHIAGLGTLEGLRWGDLYLAHAALQGDAAAHAQFERDVIEPLTPALLGAGVAAGSVDDLKQQVRVKLLVSKPDRIAKLAVYGGRGSLRSWVRVVAIRDALAARNRRKPVVDEDAAIEQELGIARDPELGFLKQEYRDSFRRCFAAALDTLPPRERTLLRLQHVERLSLDQTAKVLNIHRATVARWNSRVRQALLNETRASLTAELGVEGVELDSIMRLIQSNLEVSLHRLLRAPSD